MFNEKRIARMKWACRRGMLELDVILQRFWESDFASLDDQQREIFERLLTSDDPDLYAWFMGYQSCPDPELAAMIETIVKREPF